MSNTGAGIEKEIPRGVLGEFSKIREEFLELQEAEEMGNRIHIAHELSDLYGAMKLYAERYGFHIDEVKHHCQLKRNYFEFHEGRNG